MRRRELIERGERLKAFVAEVKGVPADWDGCSTWPAQWCADERGYDFEWPKYANEVEGRAMIEATGGLDMVWQVVAGRAGMREIHCDDPAIGDIGVIHTSKGPVGGIFTHGGGIAVRTMDGATVMGVVGRTFPRRTADGWEHVPVVIRAWALD